MPFYYILKIPIKAILIHALISADNIFLTVSFSSLIGLGKLTWDCLETNENENTTTQNLWDTVKGKVHCNTGTPQETRKKSNK